jgi:hypothetical protein
MARTPHTLHWRDLTDGGRHVETLANGFEAIASAPTPFELAYFVQRDPATRLYSTTLGHTMADTGPVFATPADARAHAQDDFNSRARFCFPAS